MSTLSTKTSRGGFTLIEVLVVVVILGLLTALTVTKVIPRGERAKADITGVSLAQLAAAINTFRLDIGHCPEALDDLVAAPANLPDSRKYQEGGYVSEIPSDGWGRKLIYRRTASPKGFELVSYGRDGKAGGEGYDADIVK